MNVQRQLIQLCNYNKTQLLTTMQLTTKKLTRERPKGGPKIHGTSLNQHNFIVFIYLFIFLGFLALATSLYKLKCIQMQNVQFYDKGYNERNDTNGVESCTIQ